MKTKGESGRTLWHKKVQDNYSSIEQLQAYDEIYNIAIRCGFDNVDELWDANPMLQGSTDPQDFGLAR